jgi:sarcosine oxidase subunit gamma
MLACPDGAAMRDFAGCALTDQSDGWVTLDLRAPDAEMLERVLEKLVNLDLRRFQTGQARRAGLAHLSAFVLRMDAGHARIFGPRSAAGTLWHALDTAARQNSAPLHT